MQITIDTNKDSHEDIKKAIRLLASMVGHENVTSNEQPRNIFDNPQPATEPSSSENIFGGLFDSTQNVQNQQSNNTYKEKEEDKDGLIEYY